MLADACEALVRSEHPANVEEVDALVEKIIHQGIEGGQLDECDLTLRELDVIRGAFLDVLKGIFHPRIQYPETPAEERRGEREP